LLVIASFTKDYIGEINFGTITIGQCLSGKSLFSYRFYNISFLRINKIVQIMPMKFKTQTMVKNYFAPICINICLIVFYLPPKINQTLPGF